MKNLVAVTGAGGFIGHWLVRALKQRGNYVIGIDIKKPEFSPTEADEFWFGDLRDKETAKRLLKDVDQVYALAADVGGVGHLSRWNYEILKNNLEIDSNTLQAVLEGKPKRILFTSSACVYPQYLQNKEGDHTLLKEEQTHPADPEGSYGWEKLIMEQMLMHAAEEKGADVRISRFQNVYGPEETFQGGREKVIGALCRKVVLAEDHGEIDIWGDGEQRRSFCYVEDCVNAIIELMESHYTSPLNICGDSNVSIDEVAQSLAIISKKNLFLNHIQGPQGVRGRYPDNSRRKKILKWEPKIGFEEGLARTYSWVESQIMNNK